MNETRIRLWTDEITRPLDVNDSSVRRWLSTSKPKGIKVRVECDSNHKLARPPPVGGCRMQ